MQQKSEFNTIRKLWESNQKEQPDMSFWVIPSVEDDLSSVEEDKTEAKALLAKVIEENELPKDLIFKEYEKLLAFTKLVIQEEDELPVIQEEDELPWTHKYAAILAAYFQNAELAIDFLSWYEERMRTVSASNINKLSNRFILERAINVALPYTSHNFPAEKQVGFALDAKRWDSCLWFIKNYPIDMNARYGINKMTIIQRAVRHPNSIEMIKLLIRYGASLTTFSGLYISTQYFAAEAGGLELLKWLDAHELDMNIKTPYERTLLHAAATGGHIDVVKWLVEIKGLNVNDVSSEHESPLHDAVESNKPEIVQYLISHQASVSVRNKAGRMPIQVAACYSHWDIVKILIPLLQNKNEKDIDGKALVHYAAESADSDTINILFSHGADVNLQDNHGYTPLHYVMRSGKWDVARTLIVQCGADTEKKNNKGYEPLDRNSFVRLFLPPPDLLDLFSKKGRSDMLEQQTNVKDF